MSIDTSWEPLAGMAAALSAAEDRRAMGPYASDNVLIAPGLEVKRNVIDPSGGANYMGGSSFEPGMPFMTSSMGLAQAGMGGMFRGDPMKCLGVFNGGLAGFDAVEENAVDETARVRDFQRILAVATQPGTQMSGVVARKLADKSMKLADLADKRAQVTQDARDGYQKALREVARLDQKAETLLNKGDIIGAENARKEGFEQGRLAVRYQKVNALATGMTQNAVAQAKLTQQLADAVLAGRPDVAAALGVAYDNLASASEDMRQLRAKQVQNAKQGLSGFDGLDDVYEAELNHLEGLDGGFFKKLKSAAHGVINKVEKVHRKINPLHKLIAKKVVDPLKKKAHDKILNPIHDATVKAAKKVGQVAAKLTIGLPCKLAKTKIVGQAVGAVGTAVGTFYGGPVGGAVGKRAAERAHGNNLAMCGALDKIGITQGKYKPGAVKGALKGAAKEIAIKAIDPREALKTLTAVGTSYVSGGAGAAGGSAGGSFDVSKIMGGGSGGGGFDISKIVGGSGNGNILATYAKGGGGDLLNFGSDAFKKYGMQNLQGQYMDRMKQVATDQITARGKAAVSGLLKQQAGNLVQGALRSFS